MGSLIKMKNGATIEFVETDMEPLIGREEYLMKEAYACLKDLGINMSYNSFLQWLKLKLGEQNESTTVTK